MNASEVVVIRTLKKKLEDLIDIETGTISKRSGQPVLEALARRDAFQAMLRDLGSLRVPREIKLPEATMSPADDEMAAALAPKEPSLLPDVPAAPVKIDDPDIPF